MKQEYAKVTQFKTLDSFREYLKEQSIEIGLSELPPAGSSALAQKLEYNGRVIGNRWAILPMEGWDCAADGSPSEFTRRRWLNFAASGAKLIYGTEAAAVTVAVAGLLSARAPKIEVITFDRPFLYAIVKSDNSEVFFAGKVGNPNEK